MISSQRHGSTLTSFTAPIRGQIAVYLAAGVVVLTVSACTPNPGDTGPAPPELPFTEHVPDETPPSTPFTPSEGTPPVSSTPPTPDPRPLPTTIELAKGWSTSGMYDVTLIPEASGIVTGRANPDLYWIVDDGPTNTVFGVDVATGETVAQLRFTADTTDIEDIAIGPCSLDDTTWCLHLGDIGDNDAERDTVAVHRITEPPSPVGVVDVPVVTSVYLVQDGPVDAEALLVTPDGEPLVLTKEPDVTRVLRPNYGSGVLETVAAVPIPPPPHPLITSIVGSSVTAADSSQDGTRVLLRTYDHIVEFVRDDPSSHLDTFHRWSTQIIDGPFQLQGEAIAYHGDVVVAVGEGQGQIAKQPR